MTHENRPELDRLLFEKELRELLSKHNWDKHVVIPVETLTSHLTACLWEVGRLVSDPNMEWRFTTTRRCPIYQPDTHG